MLLSRRLPWKNIKPGGWNRNIISLLKVYTEENWNWKQRDLFPLYLKKKNILGIHPGLAGIRLLPSSVSPGTLIVTQRSECV